LFWKENSVAEYATKSIFICGEYTFTITAYDVQANPLTIRFRVDKTLTKNPGEGPHFETIHEFKNWPYGIEFVETDILVHYQFTVIERAIRRSNGILPSETDKN